MKLERLSEYVTIVVVTVIGCGLAVICGQMTGGGRMAVPLAIFGGAAAILTALIMRGNIWLLIPLFWPMEGKLAGMASMPLRNLVICYVMAVFFALKALKVVRTKPVYRLIDLLALVNLAWIASLYVRNPVGTAAFGTELAGGRPYFDILCAAFAYWIFGHMSIGPSFARVFPLLVPAGDFLQGFFSFLTFHFPSTALVISRIYTGISATTYNNPNFDRETIREGYLGPIGINLARVLSAYFPPITLFNPIHIFRFLAFLFSLYCVVASGFRIGFFSVGVFIALGAYFRKGIVGVAQLAIPALPVLVCVVALNGVAFDLPIPAQRALSFLPGKWDQRAIASAQGSSEWRFEMWKIILHSNKYISNWWLGDGFAISRAELLEGERALSSGQNQEENQKENLMLAGDYHNGPLSAIKFGGYVGLALIMLLLLATAVLGWHLIRKTKGTPFFPLALLFGSSAVFYPFKFVFIFGSYKTELPIVFFNIAIMTLTERSLDSWLEQEKQKAEAGKDIATRYQGSFPPMDFGANIPHSA